MHIYIYIYKREGKNTYFPKISILEGFWLICSRFLIDFWRKNVAPQRRRRGGILAPFANFWRLPARWNQAPFTLETVAFSAKTGGDAMR